jgi:hypothetical protein
MPDPALLLSAVDRLADRFRSMPQGRLMAPVPGHPSRAAAALELARRLTAGAQAVERGEGGFTAGLRTLPDAGPFAAGDQLAVAGHDLAAALADLPGDAQVPTADGAPCMASDLLAGAVAAVGAVAELV